MLCSAWAAHAASADYALQGYVNYNTNNRMGWYRMADNGETTFAWQDQLTKNSSPLLFGWMRNDRVCGISSLLEGGIMYTYQYVEINPETGEYLESKTVNLKNEDGSTNYLNYYRLAAYDPVTDRVYGYGYNETGKAFVFKSSAPDFSETRIIREIPDEEYCSSLTFNEAENRLVGFNRTYFVYIDLKTGIQTVAYYPQLSEFLFTYTGLMYDVNKRAYYWNYFTKDNKSHMALVDITNKKVSTVCDYTDMTQFSFMVPMSGNEDPAAPAKPVFGKADFPMGALSGSISFTLPEKTNGGDKISGELQWSVSVDGTDCASGKGNAGETVTVPVNDLSTGEHLFTLSVSLDGKQATPASLVHYVGTDTPSAPENVYLDATTVRWDMVETGIHGGYVDPKTVKYRVSLNGSVLGTTSSTSMDVAYPADASYSAYTATVTAIGEADESAAAASNVYRTGKPLTLPQTLVPDQMQAGLFSTEDTDGNGNVWAYNNAARGQELFVSGYSSETAVDEWLFLPPVACPKADGVYSISLNAALNSINDKAAKIEIKAGREANSKAMKTTVLPLTQITNTSLKEFGGLFTLTGDLEGASGVVIGIRVYAPEGGTQVKARRFKAELTKIASNAPANPSDLKIEAAPKGALNAILSFTMPDRLINGDQIPAGTDVSVAILNDSRKTVTGKPGSAQNVTIDAYQGINEIEITPSIGSLKGQTITHEVYCGIDVPGRVGNLVADVTEDNLEAYVTWDIPTTGLNGGYIDPAGLTYWLCTYDKVTDSYKQYAELGSIPEYSMTLPEGSKLTSYDVVIQAQSSAGASSEYASVRVQLGTPYKLTVHEDFINGEGKPHINYTPVNPLTTGEYANTSWMVGDPAEYNENCQAPENSALIGSTTAAGSVGCIHFPKFSSKGANGVAVSFNVYQSNSTPKITVYASTVGMTGYEEIGVLPASGSGFSLQHVVLPAKYADKGWVSVYITVDYDAPYQNVFICEYNFTTTDGVDDTYADGNDTAILISSCDGAISVAGTEGLPVAVYSADGKIAASTPSARATESFRLQPGLYIVKAGGKSTKVLVR